MNGLDTNRSVTTRQLPDWCTVLDFLARLVVKSGTKGSVSITRRGADWTVRTDLSCSNNIRKVTKPSARGAALYDLYW